MAHTLDDELEDADMLEIPETGETLGFMEEGLHDSGYATPRQKLSKSSSSSRRTHHSQDSRYSLAFELASADDGPADYNQDLMAELGLVDEEEHDFSFGDTSFDSQESELLDLPTPSFSEQLGQSQRRSDPRVVVLSSNTEEEEMREFERISLDLQKDSANIGESLAKLRTHTTESTATVRPASDVAERQAFLDSAMNALARTFALQIKQRENQVRELMDANLAIQQFDFGILAELELLPQSPTIPQDCQSSIANLDHLSVISNTTPSPSPTQSTFGHTNNKLTQPINDLKQANASLLNALGHINEHSQVLRAAQHDTSRKLKSIQSAVSSLEKELDSVEKSRNFVETWERLQSSSTFTPNRRYQTQVEAELKTVAGLFDSAWLKASQLLATPA